MELASEPMPPDSSGHSLFGATGQCAQSSLRRAWFSGTSHIAPSFSNLLPGVGTEARLCLPGEGWQPEPTPGSARSICAAHLHSSTQMCQLSLWGPRTKPLAADCGQVFRWVAARCKSNHEAGWLPSRNESLGPHMTQTVRGSLAVCLTIPSAA